MSDTKQDVEAKLHATYHVGATTVYACSADPRFSYSLYVPRRLGRMDRSRTTILVSMHGTGRMMELYRDMFAEFAEYNNCIVLAPLFPANVRGDGNMSGYKFLREGDIRYDHILLSMVDEVAARYGVPSARFFLFGFSGGGHFTHRFTLLHPGRVRAASVGAPGVVTLADGGKPWWVGTSGAEAFFGTPVDLAALKGLPMHFTVGGADTETWEITIHEGDRPYMPGINDAGANRIERITSLRESFRAHGALTRLDIVPGETHDVTKVAPGVRAFFADVLNGEFQPD
jgi:poly(3-hydroxybutyrate) depolymerase